MERLCANKHFVSYKERIEDEFFTAVIVHEADMRSPKTMDFHSERVCYTSKLLLRHMPYN